MGRMSSTDTTTETPEQETRGWTGLDTAGLCAGILLAVILADILTDGRLISRRLRPRPPQPAADEQVPVE
jgi:hypothetical protein